VWLYDVESWNDVVEARQRHDNQPLDLRRTRYSHGAVVCTSASRTALRIFDILNWKTKYLTLKTMKMGNRFAHNNSPPGRARFICHPHTWQECRTSRN